MRLFLYHSRSLTKVFVVILNQFSFFFRPYIFGFLLLFLSSFLPFYVSPSYLHLSQLSISSLSMFSLPSPSLNKSFSIFSPPSPHSHSLHLPPSLSTSLSPHLPLHSPLFLCLFLSAFLFSLSIPPFQSPPLSICTSLSLNFPFL